MSGLKITPRLSDRERLFARLARSIGWGQDPIYHGTRAPTQVLRSGKLKPDGNGAISFSRSPEVAAHFALLLGDGVVQWSPAVLVFSRSSLVQNYRLDPWRYGEDWVDEQEEVIWGRTIGIRRHLLGLVRESDVDKILGPRKQTFTPPGWSLEARRAFFREEVAGEALVRAGRARVRDIIVRERRRLSVPNWATAFVDLEPATVARQPPSMSR
jgi:hypothetical protein